jgi:hypothetical protein
MKNTKSLYKENFLFWLMFKVFAFIWLLSTVIFIAFCNYYDVVGDSSSIGAYMNLLVFDATIFTPIAAYFFYDSWKEQHNAKLCSDIAQRIWGKLDLVSNLTHDPSRKFNKIWEISNNDFANLKPYMLKVMSQLEHTIIEVKSDLDLLGKLLDEDISSNLNSNFKNFTYDGAAESIDIFEKLQDQYYMDYYPYQEEVKKLLIPIIRA